MMAVQKINISLEPEIVVTARERANALGLTFSRYVGSLIEHDARAARDTLADEGYRLLSADSQAFAETALPLADETWPTWEDQDA